MNSPDRASGGSPAAAPQDVVPEKQTLGDNGSSPKKKFSDSSPGGSSGKHNRIGSAGTESTATRSSSQQGRTPSSGSSDGGGGGGGAPFRESRDPSPRSSAVDPSRPGDAEVAAGSGQGSGGGGRQRSSRQSKHGHSHRRSHRRSASDGDRAGAAAASDERRRQRLLKTRQFQSERGVAGGRLEGGYAPQHDYYGMGGGGHHGHRSASSPGMATSADAAAVGFNPAAAGLTSSERRKHHRHHHRGSRHSIHRRANTLPELPTHEEGMPSPAAHPAVIAHAQAQAQMMAAQQGVYGAQQFAQAYYPQPQQLFPTQQQVQQISPKTSPQSDGSGYRLAQGQGPSVPALQGEAPSTPTGGSSGKKRSSKKERRRRLRQMSDPSGALFGGGSGGQQHLPPVSPASAAQTFSPFPPAPPLASPVSAGGAPQAAGPAGAPPRPHGIRGRSSSYSVGDVPHQQQQQQHHQTTSGGGPIQPQFGDRFSARTEFLALSKPLSSSQRRLMEGLGVDAAAPSSPRGQHQVIGLGGGPLPPRSPRRVTSANAAVGGSRRSNSFDVGAGAGMVGGMRGLSPLTEHMTLSKRDLQMPHVPQVPHLDGGTPPAGGGGGGGGGESSPLISSGQDHRVYTAPDGTGDGGGAGEPFLAENFGRSSPRRSSRHLSGRHGSQRKMHMRQQSVQLFMEDVRGEVQPRRCRDAFFAILFYLQLGAMIAVGVMFGPDALRSRDGDTAASDGGGKVDPLGLHVTYRNVFLVACMCGAFAAALSALALVVMTLIARRLVQVALVFSIGMAFAWGTIGIGLSPKSFVPITGIIALALTVGYTFVVWDRIPFAAANLRTALSGIRSNLGAVAVAFLFQTLALVWSVYYAFAVIGLYDAIENGDVNVGGDAAKVFVYIGLGVAYYWTFQVMLHTVQSTVAGVVGDWWYRLSSDTSSCCSESLSASFLRSTVLSSGSICLGSLLVGPVQVLRQVAENFRPNREATVLMCLHECLSCFQECAVGCVDRLAEVYHPWAFTYVGMYGYGFDEAGRKASELFRKRGWATIVSDDLIPNVLFIVSLVIGGVTGCFGLLVEALDGFRFTNLDKPVVTAFLVGLAVGVVLSSVLFSIISASVNAIIVCFAGSPVEFQQNHPDLSNDMRSAWREVWPGCMDIVDMKIGIGTTIGGGMGSADMQGSGTCSFV